MSTPLRARHAGCALAFAIVLLAPTAALAHGRPPAVVRLLDSEGGLWVGAATWGLVRSDDRGATWRWVCAAAYEVDARREDPALAVLADGTVLVGGFDGLHRGSPDGCEYARPTPELTDTYVIDIAAVGASSALVVETDTRADDQIWRTDDGGRTWSPVAGGFGPVLIDGLEVAPSDPNRVYLAGCDPNADGGTECFVYRSDDGGREVERFPFTTEGREWSLQLDAVDPTNPDRVFAHVLNFDGEDAPERVVRSDDGGETWDVIEGVPSVGGVALHPDGRRLVIGSRFGGVWTSEDGGDSFTVSEDGRAVTCAAFLADGELWLCLDGADDERTALLHLTEGETETRAFADLSTRLTCPRCSTGGIVCPAWAPDVAYDLRLDASVPEGFDPDGGTGAPRDAGVPCECAEGFGLDAGACAAPPPDGCGCAAAGAPSGGPWWTLLAVAGAWLRRWRRVVG